MRKLDRTSWARRAACLLATAALVSGTVITPTDLEAGRGKRFFKNVGRGVVHVGEEIGDFAEDRFHDVRNFGRAHIKPAAKKIAKAYQKFEGGVKFGGKFYVRVVKRNWRTTKRIDGFLKEVTGGIGLLEISTLIAPELIPLVALVQVSNDPKDYRAWIAIAGGVAGAGPLLNLTEGQQLAAILTKDLLQGGTPEALVRFAADPNAKTAGNLLLKAGTSALAKELGDGLLNGKDVTHLVNAVKHSQEAVQLSGELKRAIEEKDIRVAVGAGLQGTAAAASAAREVGQTSAGQNVRGRVQTVAQNNEGLGRALKAGERAVNTAKDVHGKATQALETVDQVLEKVDQVVSAAEDAQEIVDTVKRGEYEELVIAAGEEAYKEARSRRKRSKAKKALLKAGTAPGEDALTGEESGETTKSNLAVGT